MDKFINFSCKLNSSRGCRNNNPLNIRVSNSLWLGKLPSRRCSDSVFEQFEHLEFGVRAACKLLYRYINVYHLRSVYSVIHRWAPSSDGNNVDSYVTSVIADLTAFPHVNPYYLVPNKVNISALVVAMAKVESCLDLSFIDVYQVCVKYKIG